MSAEDENGETIKKAVNRWNGKDLFLTTLEHQNRADRQRETHTMRLIPSGLSFHCWLGLLEMGKEKGSALASVRKKRKSIAAVNITFFSVLFAPHPFGLLAFTHSSYQYCYNGIYVCARSRSCVSEMQMK